MDTSSSDKKELVSMKQVVRCTRYRLPMFVSLEKCIACEHHKGVQLIQKATNGMPDVYDVRCALPTSRRVEYIIVDEEVRNGTPE